MEEEIQQQPLSQIISPKKPSPVETINNLLFVQSPPIYDPVLINHPIFSHDKDPILSLLINKVKSLINQTPDINVLKSHAGQMLQHLIAIVFNNVDINTLKEEFQRLGLSFDTICGRFIGNDEIYFRCLDCDRFKDTTSSIYALLCSQCFENSNHAGHRFLMVKKDSNTSATCDCGDHTAFDPTGFCKDHQPKEYCINETLSKFPQNFLNKFFVVLKNVFYGIVSLFEISYAANEKTKEALTVLAQLTLEGTLVFCQICSEEINEAFLIVFGQLLKSNFLSNYSGVWHDCQDITAEKGVKAVDVNNPHTCSCTIAGNLLRLGNASEHEIQGKLNKFLVECAKEPQFKVFLVKEFTRYLPYLYSESYSSDEFDDVSNSRLLNMKAQLYGSEDLCLEVLNSGYFSNFIGIMKKTIHNAYQANHEVYHTTSDIRSALLYFLNNKSKTSEYLLKNTTLLSQVLEVLMNFQMKFTYEGPFNIGLFDHQVDYKCINRGLMIEKVISQILDQGIKLIADLPQQEKLLLIQKFSREWLGCFETTKIVLNEEHNKGVFSFHPALERVLVSAIRFYRQQLSQEAIETAFNEILPGIDASKLSERVIEGCLRSLGMIRFLHLAHNLNSGKLWQVYYFTNNLFFEMDILTIQTMTTAVRPEILFETFVDNYFAYDSNLREFFRKPEVLQETDERLKQKILVLQDFFHLFIYLMNDETCDLSSRICKDIQLASEETQLSTKCHRVIEKVLINLLLGQYWVDVPQLKETMKSILIQHSDVDEILHKVAIFDEKNKKVRIKDEYQNELDPYIFFRNPALQNEIILNVASKAKKDEKVDLISGKFYKGLPSNLKLIQKKIFQSNLPNYLSSFLFHFEKHTASLLRPVLKLILTNLQVVEESTKDQSYQALKAKIQENYLNQSFIDRLSEIAKDQDFKDCELCIEKIQKLIQTLSSNANGETSLNLESKEISQEDHIALKKKLAHQRMQQLKEEFSKKQKMFLHKNTHHLSEETAAKEEANKGDVMEAEDHGLSCQFCLDKINKGTDTYGIPVYVSFTNNLRDIEEEGNSSKKEDHPERLESEWWPVVSSCMHHYHEKCFQNHYNNSRKFTNDNMSKLFINKFEFCCSLCNTLCNAFMIEEESKSTKLPNQEGNSQQTQENEQNLQTFSFAETLEFLLKDLRKRLVLEQNETMEEEFSVEVNEIFKRGYAYFLESFHQIEKVSTFEKMLKIYQIFIKDYCDHIKKNSTPRNPVQSLLSTIFAQNHFGNSHDHVQEKITLFSKFKSEPLLNSHSLELLLQSNNENEFLQEQFKLLKEYIAFKIVQLVLYCKESEPVTLHELYLLYKEDEELREDVVDELLFPIQKLVLATLLNNSIIKGEEKVNERVLDLLLNPDDDNIPAYLDNLIRSIGFGESFDKIIQDSLEELVNKEANIVDFISQVLAHDTSGMTLVEPRSIKLASQMVDLPKTYLDFISVYLKKKCSRCNEYTKHMSTAVCLICGDVICLAYCASTPQKRGNLNYHARQCHMGAALFIEVQRLSKSVVGCSKNILYAGKDIYRDKLGHSIQSMLNDPRCLLYSLEFDKFELNEDFVKESKEIIEQNNMIKEVYKVTKASGYYYAEGNI